MLRLRKENCADKQLQQLGGEMQLNTCIYLENLISRIKSDHADFSPMQQMDFAIDAILEVLLLKIAPYGARTGRKPNGIGSPWNQKSKASSK